MNVLLKISGVILLIAGFILTYQPGLFGNSTLPIEPYQMIEKRVKWGLVSGLGILLIFHSQWTSWGLTVTALLVAFTLGVIAARLIGFVMDGYFPKQMRWLLIELAALIVFGFLHWKQKM